MRVGRIGAGYVLLMGISGAFIAVCRGDCRGRGRLSQRAVRRHLLATLVVISSLFQFALAARRSVPGSPHFHAEFGPAFWALFGRRHRHHADRRGHGHADCLRLLLDKVPEGVRPPLACCSRVGCCHHYRKGLVVGVSFWIGVGFQNGAIFPEFFADFAGGLLQNGMTAGGAAAIFLTVCLEAAKPGRSRMETAFDSSAIGPVSAFRKAFASRNGWAEGMEQRLDAIGEETLLTLIEQSDDRGIAGPRRLCVPASREEGGAVLEFVVAAGEERNLEDRIALLGEHTAGTPVEHEISLRLLRHLASSVRHQQYHDTDVVTVHAKALDPS